MSDSFAAEEKQKAGLPTFIGLVDAALREAKRMLERVEGDEQVYFAVDLAGRFLAAGNAVVSAVMPEHVHINGDGDLLSGSESPRVTGAGFISEGRP
jgi:hypothetical protein